MLAVLMLLQGQGLETLYSSEVRLINPPYSGIGLTSHCNKGEQKDNKESEQTPNPKFQVWLLGLLVTSCHLLE